MMSWAGIARFGLVQAALGAIVVLTTSTINRVMIVELALPAIVPGLLVTWHYALQVLRPSWGHGSDRGGRRTPWIIAGMGALALGGFGAALSVHLMGQNMMAGTVAAILSFTLIGAGVGAAGTSLLVLLAAQVEERRRAAAATIVWIMMIAGFILTAGLAGHFLDPFSSERLMAVAGSVCAGSFLLTLVAVRGLETGRVAAATQADKVPFARAIAEVWADRAARRFAIFIFVSMLAYSAQDLILEPFAGLVFGLTPGQSTKLSGVQNAGVLLGMVLVGAASTLLPRLMTLRSWTVLGCIGSALALIGLVMAAKVGPGWPLRPSVLALGFCNGVFAVAAIGSMFSMANSGAARGGVRMGLFGAAQAIAFGIGGFAGTALADLSRLAFGSPVMAYATVFAVEAGFFIFAAALAAAVGAKDGFGQAANPLVLAARHQASGS
ncbi:MAG: BCD family MFS transporter [Aestuariivirga sp.]|uniref:BCD family MFS transporter n=1 Tax=Aestuariivirga sp. TaxID=2650926 RepID=UPI0025C58372|nr:BCD family MFS transporter [Aestuariivirga sp.]MCA3559678.1 BCD family MFS transporter [Aestuariivirga sp.]